MKAILFPFYYCKLLIGVMIGINQTANPLSIKWRWNFWQSQYMTRRGRRVK